VPRTPCCLLVACAAALALAPAAQGATWSAIASGTTEDITAVEYQGPTRFWFATAAGHVFTRVGDGFAQTGSAPGVVFQDIEFQRGGRVGFAVGTNGGILRSADAGANWTPVAGIITGGQPTVVNTCAAAGESLGDVDSVRFAGDARAWLAAGGSQIFRTVDGVTASDVGATSAGWQDINTDGATCKIPADVDDLFPVPGSSAVYFASKVLGTVFFSPDALATTGMPRVAEAGAGAATGIRRLAGDPANPDRQWAADSGGAGVSYFAHTTDGWTVANPGSGTFATPASVDFNGGTVALAGSAGMIAESVDGATFYLDPAAGAAAQDWRSVSLASPAAGAIGGAGGRLVVSANANVPPAGAGGATGPVGTAPSSVLRPPALVTTQQGSRLPLFGFQPRSKPPVVGGRARRSGRVVLVAVAGAFRVPARLRAASACKGRVVLTVSRPSGKRRDLTDASVRLSRGCTYAKLLRIRRARVGRDRSLRLRVAFKGNAVVGPSSMTYKVPVR
jgi:hypothetical protein